MPSKRDIVRTSISSKDSAIAKNQTKSCIDDPQDAAAAYLAGKVCKNLRKTAAGNLGTGRPYG
jgi:hypothetical protein